MHVRVSALDEYGKPILVEASGLEARVIQHEMDHLDGVLILDRTSRDQRKQAMRTLREQLEPTPRLEERLPRHVGVRGGHARSRLADSAHRPQLVVTRPGRQAGPRRRSSRRRPSRCWPTSSASTCIQPEDLHAPEVLRADRRRAARGAHHLRVRRADQGAAAQRLRDDQRPPVAAAALARGGADRARDHGRRRRDRRGDHARDRGLGLRRRSTRSAREPIHAGRRLRHARAAAGRRSARELLVEALDARPTPVEQDESQVTYAHKIGPRERALDPTQTPEQVERTIRALRPHIGSRLPLPDGTFLGVIDARVDGPTRAPAGGLRAHGRAAAAAGLPRRRARADRRSGRPAARACPPTTGCAASRDESLTNFRFDPALPDRSLEEMLETRAARSGAIRTTSGSRTCARSPPAATREVLDDHERARARPTTPSCASSPPTCSASSARRTAALPAEQEAGAAGDGRARARPARAVGDRLRLRPPRRAAGQDWLLAQRSHPDTRRPRGRRLRARRPHRRGDAAGARSRSRRTRTPRSATGRRSRSGRSPRPTRPALRDALAARLDDPDEDTRMEAVHGLALRGDERAQATPPATSSTAATRPTTASGAATCWPRRPSKPRRPLRR